MHEVDRKVLNQALYEAAQRGNLPDVRAAIALGAEIDEVHDRGRTALHAAAASGDEAVLTVLFAAGASLRIEDEDGKTAREIAKAAGHEGSFSRALKASGRGSHVHSVQNSVLGEPQNLPALYEPTAKREPVRATADLLSKSRLLLRPLPGDRFHQAAFTGDLDTIDWLLYQNESRKNYINIRDKNGLSALDFAVLGNRSLAAKDLIERGIEVDGSAEYNKTTALMLGAALNRVSPVHILRKAANVNAQDALGNNALIYAVDFGADATLKELLLAPGIHVDLPNQRGRTALHQACIMGSVEEMQMLMESGANPVLRDNDGNTPAKLAWEYGHSNLFSEALLKSRTKRLQLVGSLGPSR